MPPFKDFLLILCILLILQFLTCYYYSTPKFLHQNAFPFQFKRRKIHSASAPSSLHHSSLRNPYLFAPVIHPSADIETTISLSLFELPATSPSSKSERLDRPSMFQLFGPQRAEAGSNRRRIPTSSFRLFAQPSSSRRSSLRIKARACVKTGERAV